MKAETSTEQKNVSEYKDLKDFEEKVLKKALVKSHKMNYQQYSQGVERWYFWIKDFIEEDLTYEALKLEDEFLSAEMSSFWGIQAQRLGMQQDKAMQMLGTIGQMIKSLFQIIRSLRIMDERLEYYKDSKKGEKSAEIALKGIWVDLVEGGAKNPSSIYGLATQVGFITLPDLFFDITPKNKGDVDRVVNKIEVNKKVKEILKRKLYQFMAWKEATFTELATSKKFHLKYLKQHVNSIKIYVRWVKPYIKNIERLSKTPDWTNPNIITALETAQIDLELFAIKWQKHDETRKIKGKKVTKGDKKKYQPCIRVRFNYTTSPQLFSAQEYQRTPVHVGKSIIYFESYVLTTDQIEEYKRFKNKEDIELLGAINESMNALKDDLDKYLAEADMEEAKSEHQSKALIGVFDDIFKKTFEPFINIGKGFKILGGALIPKTSAKKKAAKDTWLEKRDKESLKGSAKNNLWLLFETFKKAHQMVTW